MGDPFVEFAVILVLATVLGAIGVRLRQPLILAFVAIGILLGPSGFDLVSAREEMNLLSQLGITILLFVVGLKLDVQSIRHLGRVTMFTGAGQMILTFALGVPLSYVVGLRGAALLYVPAALMFSSTVIIVKVLSDKREMESLHGRVAMGVLILQDIVVIVLFAVLGTMEADVAEHVAVPVWAVPIGLLALIAVLGLLMKTVLPRIMHGLARSSELLLLFALAWGTMLAAFGESVGLSKELGAFLGGFSLASTGYREALSARLTTLRDVLLLFFFVDLGARMSFESPERTIGAAIVLSVFVLVAKPLIVTVLMGRLGYRARTGAFTGTTLAQISEFSLILVAVGIAMRHLDEEVMGLVTLVAVITITLSTYMILYPVMLYSRVERFLSVFESETADRQGEDARAPHVDDVGIVVIGLGRLGRRLIERLRSDGLSVLGVDFDPEAVRSLRSEGIPSEYGDVSDLEYLHHLPLGRARWVVSTVPDRGLNGGLISALRSSGFEGKIAVTAHNAHDAKRLEELGADEVLEPYVDAALFAAAILASDLSRRDGD